MEIYILRHGIAEDARPGQPDSERALTEEGREKLRRVLKHARGVRPTLILSSPYRRAMETAAVAAETLGYADKVVCTHALEPGASPHDTWDEVRARENEAVVLLSTHEPLSSTLVAFLLGAPSLAVDMKKAAMVRVDIAKPRPEPSGTLRWMLIPAVT